MSSDIDNGLPILKDQGDWHDHWLMHRVEFKICGHKVTGEVIGTQRFFQADGTHDILTVELEGDPKQIKVDLHRQACKLLD